MKAFTISQIGVADGKFPDYGDLTIYVFLW